MRNLQTLILMRDIYNLSQIHDFEWFVESIDSKLEDSKATVRLHCPYLDKKTVTREMLEYHNPNDREAELLENNPDVDLKEIHRIGEEDNYFHIAYEWLLIDGSYYGFEGPLKIELQDDTMIDFGTPEERKLYTNAHIMLVTK
jgi:hypothetical protein